MSKSSSDNMPNNLNTAGCPFCGYQNILKKENLLYYRDTLVVKGTTCIRCNHFIPVSCFNNQPNQDVMHG